MKTIFTMLALFLGASGAEAAIKCKTYWGTNAGVSVASDKISIQFQGGRYPGSVMRANGSNASNYYFRRNTGANSGYLAIVQKQVLNGSKGKIWYHFPSDNNDNSRSITLYCN
jgi:hypothetical protein